MVKGNIRIRSAAESDASTINRWWNDGEIMEHAGFPKGLRETLEDTRNNIVHFNECDNQQQICIIEIDGKPVGELNYRLDGHDTASVGWKICDKEYQDKGYGPIVIKMLLEFLFTYGYNNSESTIKRITWDTMLENKRAQHVYEKKIGAERTDIKENYWTDQLGNPRTVVFYEMKKEKFLKTIDLV